MLNYQVLRAAQLSIADLERPFDMATWPRCIAGHICRAAGDHVDTWDDGWISTAAMNYCGVGYGVRPLFSVRDNQRFSRTCALDRIDELVLAHGRAAAAIWANEARISRTVPKPAPVAVLEEELAYDIAAGLRRARALIADPAHWCQHVATSIGQTGIIRFCSLGALHAANVDTKAAGRYFSKVLRDMPIHNIVTYNDNHTHAAVMATWDRAIALAEADAAAEPSPQKTPEAAQAQPQPAPEEELVCV